MQNMESPEVITRNLSKLKKHPKSNSNWLTNLLFCWQIPLILKEYRRESSEDVIYEALPEYQSENLEKKISELWLLEKKQKNPSLTKVVFKIFRFEILYNGILILISQIIISILIPLLLDKLLSYFTYQNSEDAYATAASLIITIGVYCIIFNWSYMQMVILGIKVRIAVSALIFQKTLKLNQLSLQKVTIGHVINLLSNDVYRFDTCFGFIHYIWLSPIIVILNIIYIDTFYGHGGIVGVSILLVFFVMQISLSNRISHFLKIAAGKTDHRLRLMNNIINGIQVIKLYAWEKPYSALVEAARLLELNAIFKANIIRLISNSVKIYIGHICLLLAILYNILNGHPLSSQYVFGLLIIFESLKLICTFLFQMSIFQAGEARFAIKRIQLFLSLDEKSVAPDSRATTPKVVLKQLSAAWNEFFKLTQITLEAGPRSLIVITGAPGAGKSTLLQVILGELEIKSGVMDIQGTLSYSCQDCWIFSSSVRQNIIFGAEFDSERYKTVIRVCCLDKDLTMWPHGDQTLVGDRGVMLSGGQRARINLARAVYRKADIYLLDDPLSAVDVNVAEAIVNDCIRGFLKDKIVILVTHQVQLLRGDQVYQMASGAMKRIVVMENTKPVTSKENFETEKLELLQNDIQNHKKEHRSSGSNYFKVFFAFIKAAGHPLFTGLLFLIFALAQTFSNLLDSFTVFWINVDEKSVLLSEEFEEIFTSYNNLYIFSTLLLIYIMNHWIINIMFAFFTNKASKNLHSQLCGKVIHTKMEFFNHHSSGRILNRISKDIGCLDEALPLNLYNTLLLTFSLIGMLINIGIYNNIMIGPMIVLFAFVIIFDNMFKYICQNVKRTEGTTRSFIFSHISSTLQGLPIIRAFDCESRIIKEYNYYQNVNSSAMYIFITTNAAFGFWMAMLCLILVTLTVFTYLFVKTDAASSQFGLSITQSITILRILTVYMKNWHDLKAQLVSAERVLEYTKLEPEIDSNSDDHSNWPTKGVIHFEKVLLRYNPEQDPVLNNINFEIKSGEKIGIVGRTGAGKSSLITVLFRLFDFDGTIRIDNVDTKTIALEMLRSKISIISQEPVLFLGTLRKNLDPLDKYTDAQIWRSLEEIELKQTVAAFPEGLNYQIADNGGNFSVGQRQLLCLVRAILRNNKIIVLDEATANIDDETDQLIQTVIRKKFRNCTVLTIAHRLNTIMDSDRVMVMDKGCVTEFDTPSNLISNCDGIFYKFISKNPNVVDKMHSHL